MSAIMTNDGERIVAIVPAKDCGDSVGGTVRALLDVEGIDRVLVVDDGSSDDTAAKAEAAGADVLALVRNRGKGGAVAAGVKATPDATVYVLVDADVADTAQLAGALLEPVLAGDFDMAVGVLPASEGRGGFGLVRKLAATGIRRACGFKAGAPLSGQRAVRAEYLRDGLASSARFGLEVAMTIDVVRAGGRVTEVNVEMDHHHTGRSLGGFAHRGRQGVDIVASLWPRMIGQKRRIGALVLLTLLICAAAVVTSRNRVPTTQPLGHQAKKVIVFGMEPFGFDDLDRGATPNLDRLIDHGSMGALSLRTVARRPSDSEGYVTIGAGARLKASQSSALVLDRSETVGKLDAAQFVQALSGVEPKGSLVVVRGSDLARRNDNPGADGDPGTLASALARKGHASAVVANSDLPATLGTNAYKDRAAALAVMNSTFGVDNGTINPKVLLEQDPAAPYGVRANAEAFQQATKSALAKSDLVIVDPGDLTRAQGFRSRALPNAKQTLWDNALRQTDDILGRVVSEAGPDTLVLVVSVRPPHGAFRPTPIVAWGAGVPKGVITSPSTQRTGLLAITDLAPTIMSALGVTPSDTLPGNAVRYEPGSHRLDTLKRYDADTMVRERTYLGTTWVYIWLHLIILGLILFLIASRPRFLALREWLRVGLLSLAAVPVGTFLVRLIPGLTEWFVSAQVIAAAVIAVLIGLFVARRRKHPLSSLAWLCGITVAVIVADIFTGDHMQMSSWLGYSIHSAGRFYGIPNSTLGVLGACAILWAGIVVHHAERRVEALWLVGCVLFIVFLAAGAPMFGANVGGLLTLGPIFAVYLFVLTGHRIRVRTLVAVVVGMVALVAAAAAVDLTRPTVDQTHLGHFASDLLNNGPTVLTSTIWRKESANFTILQSSIWTRLLPIIAIFIFYPLVWQRRAREVFDGRRDLAIAFWMLIAAAALGFVVNDSGPIIIALIVVWLAPLVALILLAPPTKPVQLRRADGSITEFPDTGSSCDPSGGVEPEHGAVTGSPTSVPR